MTINIIKRIFYGICIVAFLAMLFFGYEAYDKKNNYYNSEYSTFLNENAYVGGGRIQLYNQRCILCRVFISVRFMGNHSNYVFRMWSIAGDSRKEMPMT